MRLAAVTVGHTATEELSDDDDLPDDVLYDPSKLEGLSQLRQSAA